MSGLKIYISADMEGVAGAFTGEQMTPAGFEYAQFREFMTEEVNAAIAAAREAGATEFVVSDSHGNALNLLMDRLPQDIQLVRSWPRPLIMMEGIDASFDAALLIGYHASASNPGGALAHTFSSRDLTAVRINGRPMTEAGINALIAGHFGVPVVMISGDDATVQEVTDTIGPIEGAVVKWQCGHTAGRTLMPEASRALIREKARTGIERRAEFEPFHMGDSLTLELAYQNDKAAELIAYLPIVDRVDNHTVRFEGSIIDITRFIQMALAYPGAMTG